MSSSTFLSSNCSVFLSFRGKDTRRRSFTDHLYRSEGVSALMKIDPTESETISAELGKVFEESRLAIVVVSRNYVSSSCCFDELSKIIECKDIREQRAIPVFYQVESSEVKNQTGHVGNENNCFQIDRDRVLNWKQTLTDLANIPSLDLKQIRGKEDTRRSFTDHLYRSEGVSAFMKVDPTESETISAELGKVFEESRLAIVIVSRNYVSSSCCFDELSKIIECKDIREQRVIPVFYQVESSEVKNQSGHVGNENNRFQIDRDRVLNWKQTLRDLANIPGLDLKQIGSRSHIQEIVSYIFLKCDFLLAKRNLDGVVSRVKEVNLKSNIDFHFVGIWGMGGIGNTTLAKQVFEIIYEDFEACDELIKNIFYEGISILRHRLHSKKTLIVLDDVANIEQLQFFSGYIEEQLGYYFSPQSKIIVTTRKQNLLMVYGVEKIYSVGEKITSLDDLLQFRPEDDDDCQKSDELQFPFTSQLIKDQVRHGKKFEIHFPYIRFPEWFSYLSMGCSIMIKPPADFDTSWIGFALFFVLEIYGHNIVETSWHFKEIICKFSTSEGPTQTQVVFLNLNGFKAGPYGFCCYLPRGWFVGQLKKARFIEASISTNRSDVKVQRCGMHIISQQNTSIFAKNLTQTSNEYLKLNFRSCQHCKQKVLG